MPGEEVAESMAREQVQNLIRNLPGRPWEARHGGEPIPVEVAARAEELLNATGVESPYQCQALLDGRIELSWLGDQGSLDVAVGPGEVTGVISVTGERTRKVKLQPEDLAGWLKRIEVWSSVGVSE